MGEEARREEFGCVSVEVVVVGARGGGCGEEKGEGWWSGLVA